MYPLSFPFTVLEAADHGDSVLDPFCGRGTTTFAARLRGLRSVGIDSNPAAAAIAAAKLVSVSAIEVIQRCEELLALSRAEPEVPTGRFWRLCYGEQTLREICTLRERLLRECTAQVDLALRALVLGILHGPLRVGLPTFLSNQMPRTYATKPGPAVRYWTAEGLSAPNVSVMDAVTRRATFTFESLPPAAGGAILRGDSSDGALGGIRTKFDWVVTSPPYYGMRTYRPDQWLRNWFVGGPASVDYSVEGQLGRGSEDAFLEGLSRTWAAVADVCNPGARLIVRFGAIASSKREPRVLMGRSLRMADAGWRIQTIRPAGRADDGRRQAAQFASSGAVGDPIQEVDIYASLAR